MEWKQFYSNVSQKVPTILTQQKINVFFLTFRLKFIYFNLIPEDVDTAASSGVPGQGALHHI